MKINTIGHLVKINPNKANFKRDLAKMGNHKTAKGVDTVMEFTLNLIKNSEAKE